MSTERWECLTVEDETFGNRLKTAREQHSLTRVQLAEQIGSSSKTVARWERGEALPQLHFHQKLCTILTTSPQELGLAITTREKPQIRCNLEERYPPTSFCRVLIRETPSTYVITFSLDAFLRYVSDGGSLIVTNTCIRNAPSYISGSSFLGMVRLYMYNIFACPQPSPTLHTCPTGQGKTLAACLPQALAAALRYPPQNVLSSQQALGINADRTRQLLAAKESPMLDVILREPHQTMLAYSMQKHASSFFYKSHLFPLTRRDRKKLMYQIARCLADIYQATTVCCIFAILVSNFFTVHPQFQLGGLVHFMQNILQVMLHILSNPAWQGISSLFGLMSIIISLFSHRPTPLPQQPSRQRRNVAKKMSKNKYVFCPTPLAA